MEQPPDSLHRRTPVSLRSDELAQTPAAPPADDVLEEDLEEVPVAPETSAPVPEPADDAWLDPEDGSAASSAPEPMGCTPPVVAPSGPAGEAPSEEPSGPVAYTPPVAAPSEPAVYTPPASSVYTPPGPTAYAPPVSAYAPADAEEEQAPVGQGGVYVPPYAPPSEGEPRTYGAPAALAAPGSPPAAPTARPPRPRPDYRAMLVTLGIPAGFAAIGALAIVLWLTAKPQVDDATLRAPGTGHATPAVGTPPTGATAPLPLPGATQPGSPVPETPGTVTPGSPDMPSGPVTPGGMDMPGGMDTPGQGTSEPPVLPDTPGMDGGGGATPMGGGPGPTGMGGGPGPGAAGGRPGMGAGPFGGPGRRPGATPMTPGPTGSPAENSQPAPDVMREGMGGGDADIPPVSQSRASPRGGGALSAAIWPGFRGSGLDNISKESAPLARSWGAGGPPKLWQVALGEGHAGPAVRNGRVYVLDYDQKARADVLRCLSLENGRQIWASSYPVEVKRNHGMSRTVPAVTDQCVVTLGPKCHVMCCNASNGKVLWRKDLVKEYGTKVPTWYAGQCPLIDGNRAIIAPSGSALMIAVDLASGKVAWQTPNPRKWTMTHSSITPMSFAGKRMYVYCGSGGVAGVSAADGKLLWDTTEWKVSTATVPSPIPIGDGRIFLCGGYNSGALMLRLVQSGVQIAAQVAFRLKVDVFGSDQQTPILYQNHLYGVVPNPAGQLACLDLNGKRLWTSGRTSTFGLGPYVMAGGLLYVLGDKGDLALVEPSPAGYKQLARAKVLTGSDAWGPMAITAGRLLARDLTTMVCLKVGA